MPLRVDALDGPDDAHVQHLGQRDLEREDLGPLLTADANGILEPGRDHEHRRLATPLEQCVGGDRRAHLDGGDAALAGRCGSEQPLDARDGRIVVAFGVDRQQLQRRELARRRAGDDVGERTAAVDPEFPAPADHSSSMAATCNWASRWGFVRFMVSEITERG